MDDSTTLKEIKKKVTDFRNTRNWKKFHNPKDLSAAIYIEASELQERFLWKNKKETENFIQNNLHKVKEEMADVAIFLLSLSDVLGVDLSEIIDEKLKENAKKYPIEKAKGNNKKYSEL